MNHKNDMSVQMCQREIRGISIGKICDRRLSLYGQENGAYLRDARFVYDLLESELRKVNWGENSTVFPKVIDHDALVTID